MNCSFKNEVDEVCFALLEKAVKETYLKKIRRFIPSTEPAELIADCWIKQIPKIKREFNPSYNVPFSKYCLSMIHYFFCEYMRNSAKRYRLEKAEHLRLRISFKTATESSSRIEREEECEALFSELSNSEQTAMRLYAFDGFSINEIGNVLNISGAGASYHLCKAKRKVLLKLQERSQ